MERVAFVIHGAPRTKKNSGRLITGRIIVGTRFRRRSPTILPSRAWENWKNTALVAGVTGPPIDYPVNCNAAFYRDRAQGDAVGYYQGLADFLEKRQIVTDDKWLISWDGSRLYKDAAAPRVEVVLIKV